MANRPSPALAFWSRMFWNKWPAAYLGNRFAEVVRFRSERQPCFRKRMVGRRRLRYNVALIFAGVLAFTCYVGVVFWGILIRAIPDPGGNHTSYNRCPGRRLPDHDAVRKRLLLAGCIFREDCSTN